MKPLTLKRFVLLPLIIFSLIMTTGCHLLAHYSEDEVHQYINKNYPNLTYHLESRRGNTWQVTFDKYPQMPIEISEVLHTSAPVVPQVERILITNIPLITAFPLMMDQFCKEYAATYPDFKEKIYIRVIIKPSDGSDAPEEYRRIFRLSQY